LTVKPARKPALRLPWAVKAQAALVGQSQSGHRPVMVQQLGYHALRDIFTRFQAADPEPKGELEHVNAYTLVVAVALSAQATDIGVNRANR